MNIAEQLFKDLSEIEGVEAIALGGSRAGEVFDSKSDYDVYLYCVKPVPEALRKELLEKYCSYIEIGNSFWEYEDNCTLSDGTDIDILYRNLDDFAAGISAVVDGGLACNGYTTCMWHNLLQCKVLYDKSGRLTALKQKYNVPYPEKLKKNIISRNMRLLRTALPAYETQIKKAVLRGDSVSVHHRVTEFLASYFDIIFALNEKTHPGEKRLISLAKTTCNILPDNFEQNIERLFKDMSDNIAQVPHDIENVIDSLEKVL